jgi:hypothetical protein
MNTNHEIPYEIQFQTPAISSLVGPNLFEARSQTPSLNY